VTRRPASDRAVAGGGASPQKAVSTAFSKSTPICGVHEFASRVTIIAIWRDPSGLMSEMLTWLGVPPSCPHAVPHGVCSFTTPRP